MMAAGASRSLRSTKMPTASGFGHVRGFWVAFLSIAFTLGSTATFAEEPAIHIPTLRIALENDTAQGASEESKPALSAETETQKSYVIPAVEIIAFDTLLNLFDRAYYGCCN